MSRSGYSEDYDGTEWDLIRWRGAVTSAIRGRRGQAFLRELLAALDALPEKRLVPNVFEQEGEVCALGAVARARGVNLSDIDPEGEFGCQRIIGARLDIASALAAEIMYENDEQHGRRLDPKIRFERVRAWVVEQIRGEADGNR